MEQVILGLLQGLLPLLQQAFAAKEAGDKVRHDAIVKELEKQILIAYAAVNGLELDLAASDEKFLIDLRAFAKAKAEELKTAASSIVEAAVRAAEGEPR